MSNYRYIISLVVSTIVYLVMGLILWFLFSKEILKEEPKEKIIKINMIKPQQVAPPVKTLKKPKNKSKVKEVTKPVAKPKLIAKIKPESKVEPIQKTVENTEKEVIKKNIEPVKIKEDYTKIENDFTNRVRNNIIKNKKYPRAARKRNIQGRVKVIFDLEKDGSISNIRINSASKILKKATLKSLNKSFPIEIPSKILDKFPKRNISINIDFLLQ